MKRLKVKRLVAVIHRPFLPSTEKSYKKPAVRVPSLQRLSQIAQGLGLEMEESELTEYRGGIYVQMRGTIRINLSFSHCNGILDSVSFNRDNF